MISIQNVSSSRTIAHQDGDEVYRLEPNEVGQFETQVGEAILAGWPIAKAIGEEKPNISAKPWEWSAGPTWERAKLENRLRDDKDAPQVVTSGPDRPEVVESAIPSDAINPDTGRIVEAKLNTHVCNICEKQYKMLGALRTHQRKEHNS